MPKESIHCSLCYVSGNRFASGDCGVPDEIPNASKILSGTVEGKASTYQCHEKFGFDDGSTEVTVTCLATGEWSGDVPQCLSQLTQLYSNIYLWVTKSNHLKGIDK